MATDTQPGILEIVDAGITPGPKGETGIIDVLYGTDPPPDPTGLKEGTVYIKYI